MPFIFSQGGSKRRGLWRRMEPDSVSTSSFLCCLCLLAKLLLWKKSPYNSCVLYTVFSYCSHWKLVHLFAEMYSSYTMLHFNQQYIYLIIHLVSDASWHSTWCVLLIPLFVLPLSLRPSIPASNTGRWARGAKQRLNLVSEPRLILYSFPLKEHESCSLPVVAAVPPSIRKTNGRSASVPA